jgi:hypothetical protein
MPDLHQPIRIAKMNPYYLVTVSLATITTIAVSAFDHGKTGTPPHSVVSQLLHAGSSSSTVGHMTNAITGVVYWTTTARARDLLDPDR